MPTPDALTLDGLDISSATIRELLGVDTAEWQKEAEETGVFFKKFGNRLPAELREEQAHLTERLNPVTSAKG